MKKYYSMQANDTQADIYIYGDITSWEWQDSDISSYTLSKEIEGLDPGIGVINCYLNSCGGQVSEGLAIYNALKRHKAKVRTYCDGFACSIASVVFMAGDERIMSNSSLLMIHNAWMLTAGNAGQLRKDADDLDIITQASINAYMSEINISEEKLKQLLDSETWLLPQGALEMGFATSIIGAAASQGKASASARKALFELVQSHIQKAPEPILAQQKPGFLLKNVQKSDVPTAIPEPTPLIENKLLKLFAALPQKGLHK